MVDLTIDVQSFEAFLAEDTKSLAHAGHSKKNGDAGIDKVEGDGIKDGSETAEVVEKSNDKAPGDDKGETLPKPPTAHNSDA